MKWFYDMKIAAKLPAIFCLLAAIAGGIGWIGFSKVGQLRDSEATMYAARLVPIQDLAYANFAFLNARTDLRDLLLAKDKPKRDEIAEAIGGDARPLRSASSPTASGRCRRRSRICSASFESHASAT